MTMVHSDRVKVVLFGSVLTNPETARDVDVAVAYAGVTWDEQYGVDKPTICNRALDIVERWSREPADVLKRRVRENKLDFDIHFTYMASTSMPGTEDLSVKVSGPGSVPVGGVRIPSPWGIEVPALAITPGTEVERFPVFTIPAALRAFGDDAEKLSKAIYFLMSDIDIADAGGHLLGVPLPSGGPFPAPGGNRFYASHIDIGGPYADDREEWSEYVCGLRALRSAIEHAPAWKDAQFSAKRLLARLNARGASREGIQYARNYSPGGRARLFLRSDFVTTEYGPRLSYKDAEEMFIR